MDKIFGQLIVENQEVSAQCSLDGGTLKDSCVTCPLRKKSLLNELSSDELEILNENRVEQYFKSGEIIYHAGEKPLGLICLNSGKIKITKSDETKNEIITDLKRPVDFISVKSLMTGETYSDTATALCDTDICIINKESFFKVLNNNSKFAIKLVQFFAKKLDESESKTFNLTKKHMRARLAEALLLDYNIYGITEDNVLNVQLKRSELAALANMIPSNAIRILSEFAKEEIVKTDRQNISIVNMIGLKEISHFGYTLKKN